MTARSSILDFRHPPAELEVNPEIPDSYSGDGHQVSQIPAIGQILEAQQIEQQIQQQHVQNQTGKANYVEFHKAFDALAPPPLLAGNVAKSPQVIPQKVVDNCQFRCYNLTPSQTPTQGAGVAEQVKDSHIDKYAAKAHDTKAEKPGNRPAGEAQAQQVANILDILFPSDFTFALLALLKHVADFANPADIPPADHFNQNFIAQWVHGFAGNRFAAHQEIATHGIFQQVGDSSRKAEGTGLGLAISQKIVNMMGGRSKSGVRKEQAARFGSMQISRNP